MRKESSDNDKIFEDMKKYKEEVVFKRGEKPEPISLDSKINYEEEFLPDIRKSWMNTEVHTSCGLHRNCSWEDITGIDDSLEKINLLAGTLVKDEETGKTHKKQPAHSDKFKTEKKYSMTELTKGCSRKELELLVTNIVEKVVREIRD